MTVLAAFLASAAAAWAAGGLFTGAIPRIVAVVSAVLGCGIVVLSTRSNRPGLVQSIGIPAIFGAAFLLSLTGGGGSVLDAIGDAVRGGGPSGEALVFSSGWRFLLVVLIASLAAGAASLALLTDRPRLAVVVPVPALIGASLVQPRGATLVSAIPAMMLLLGALAVSFGVQLAGSGATSARFEVRRIGRGALAIGVVAALLFGVAQAGVGFPDEDQERVIPPRLPPDVPPTPDRVLFNVRTKHPGPWRLGVLDVYDGEAWRLPSYDPARLVPVPSDGAVPGARPVAKTIPASFEIVSMQGPVLPGVSGLVRTTMIPEAVFDPRVGVLRLPAGRSQNGASYTLDAPPVATGKQLAEAPLPPASVAEFLEVPKIPAQVGVLLADAPRAPLWDRLQYARTAYYRKVIAAGAGKPVAVPPARVDEIVRGEAASPYEIAAAEALIARWAGIPARIGYGFFGGEKRGTSFEVRPRHAATWLEVYFEGLGWIPVVGVPPRARASLNRGDQQQNPEIRPTEQLALVLYVPVQERSIRLFYTLARYWLAVTLPIVLAILAAIVFYPGALKAARRIRRARWAMRKGPRARIAVAYADVRDTATDLGVGDPSMTPMAFARAVAHDDELEELSWLVSRALWGDLTRDVRDDDADVAERLARSIRRRLGAAQPATTRILGSASRASLRDPYTREVPNMWPARRLRLRLLPFGAALLAIGVLGSCGSSADPTRAAGGELPTRIVPVGINNVSFQREEAVESRVGEAGDAALIDAARVFTFRGDGAVQGYLEVASFRPDVSGSRDEVRRGVLSGIGAERFKLTRVGALRVYTATIGEQNFALWFAPEGGYFELLVQRRTFGDHLDLFARILEYQGRTVGARTGGTTEVPAPDPRRGEAII